MHLDPAASIIERLGGLRAVSEIAGVDQSRVSRWRLPKDKGGTGGTIPQRHAGVLLAHAKRSGIALTAEELLAVNDPVSICAHCNDVTVGRTECRHAGCVLFPVASAEAAA